MSKQLGIALGLLIALFGIGYVVYGQVFDDSKTSEGAPVAQDTPPPVQAPPDAAPPKEPSTQQATVRSISGGLERKATDGQWQALAVGDVVSVNDALRTLGDDAAAVIDLGPDGSTIRLSGEFTVPTLTAKLSTVEVVDGQLAANVVAEAEGTLRVEARGADAVAETSDGDFSVLSTGTGEVAVASRRGNVALSSAGKTVSVSEGEQSVVTGGGPPSPPEKLPSALLLKVGKTARELRVRETIVRGITTPGAIVSVSGIRVQANERGEFVTKIPLKEGRNRLTLVVEDSLGRREKQKLPPLVVDSKAPSAQTGVEW